MCRSAWRFLVVVVGLILSFQAFGYGTVGQSTVTRWCRAGSCYDSALDGYRALLLATNAGSPKQIGSPSCAAAGNSMFCQGAGWAVCTNNDINKCWGERWISGQFDPLPTSVCPNFSTLKAGLCECIQGFKPGSSSECVPVSCPAGGSYSVVTQPDMLVATVGNVCKGGCEAVPNSFKVAADGSIYAEWPFRYTGQNCTGKTDAQGIDQSGDKGFEEKPTACGSGKCPGTFNGQSMCVPCSGGAQVDQGKTTQPGTVPADQPGVDGVKGAQTKETSTNCTGSKCTTTDTYRDGNGTIVGEKKTEKPKENFCQENPGISICKQGRWGGSCSGAQANFSCDGDPVQCALALEVHRRGCEWSDVKPELLAAGEKALLGDLRPDGHPLNTANTQSLSFASQIDQTNRLAGGCPVDDHFSVMGQSVVIPWSTTCDALAAVGSVIVGVCMLAAAFIVFRS